MAATRGAWNWIEALQAAGKKDWSVARKEKDFLGFM